MRSVVSRTLLAFVALGAHLQQIGWALLRSRERFAGLADGPRQRTELDLVS